MIDERFGVRGDHGVDYEIMGCTGDVPGGGFIYTNADTLAVGLVCHCRRWPAAASVPGRCCDG